jgi:hypothetical protein
MGVYSRLGRVCAHKIVSCFERWKARPPGRTKIATHDHYAEKCVVEASDDTSVASNWAPPSSLPFGRETNGFDYHRRTSNRTRLIRFDTFGRAKIVPNYIRESIWARLKLSKPLSVTTPTTNLGEANVGMDVMCIVPA